MDNKYSRDKVVSLSGSELDNAVADVLGWEICNDSDEPYYSLPDGNVIPLNAWEPTRRPRQMVRIMMDWRIGVVYSKLKKRWKAMGYVDQSIKNLEDPPLFSYGITPAEAVCRCLILLKEHGGMAYPDKVEERLLNVDD